MVGKTNVGGGGKLFAVIAATYPEGSVCTCTNGTKTLKARDTSGKALFNVPLGEWTVSCTDGAETASKTVSITTEGQSESVTLSYELVLFDYGDNTSVTGGWNKSKLRFKKVSGQAAGVTPTVTTNTDGSINVVSSAAGGSGSYITVNAIDLTGYSTVRFIGSVTESSGEFHTHSGFSASQNLTEFLQPNSAASMNFPNEANTSYLGTENFLDISSLSGDYYFIFGVYNSTKVTIKKLWLE